MASRVYLSNLSPVWPLDRQEALLAEGVPEWPEVAVYRDQLKPRQRRAHRIEDLAERRSMLRPTSRGRHETIYVASLAVLAWTAEDMLECLTLALSRNAVVRVLDADLDIGPGVTAATLHRAAKAFAEGRKSRAGGEAGLVGGEVSGKRRSEAAKVAAESIRAEWGLPSADYPTRSLLERAGISRNTAKLYLGSRAAAQNAHQASMKRRESAFAKRGRFAP